VTLEQIPYETVKRLSQAKYIPAGYIPAGYIRNTVLVICHENGIQATEAELTEVIYRVKSALKQICCRDLLW
jgi:hypothetical protein